MKRTNRNYLLTQIKMIKYEILSYRKIFIKKQYYFPIFFSFLLKKKELEFLIFLKFFDISFFFLQKKKRKQSNVTKNIGNIF